METTHQVVGVGETERISPTLSETNDFLTSFCDTYHIKKNIDPALSKGWCEGHTKPETQ